jgi:hypothetical protein
MIVVPSKQELESAHCWEADDHVPRQPAMTEFRRGLRYRQAQWREANGHKPQPPKPKRLSRYREITDTSRAFSPEALDAVNGTSLVHIWLAHALVLSMLQYPSNAWRLGRFGVVHAAGNSDFADACTRYGELLVDQSTFTSVTIETLLDSDELPASTVDAFRDRYLGD